MKKIITLLLALAMVLVCAGCGGEKKEELKEDPEPTPQKEEQYVANPLTGEPLEDPASVNNRPFGIMLNNIHVAMPQHGVSDADMIFEYNAEGGITRMVGFFQEVGSVGTIGSVRSARPYFVETVLGMDAIYVHAGGSTKANSMLQQYGVDDITEGDFDCFWRDEERAKTMAFEHTLMTSGSRLKDYTADNGWRLKHEDSYQYPVTFAEDGTPAGGTNATDISVEFSSYKTGTFTYDPASKLYMIGQYDGPYIDGNTNEQVGITNLLILRASTSLIPDTPCLDIDISGSGDGIYICGGKAIDIQWHKEDVYDPFSYTTTDGSSFPFGIGKTYVCVVEPSAPVSVS